MSNFDIQRVEKYHEELHKMIGSAKKRRKSMLLFLLFCAAVSFVIADIFELTAFWELIRIVILATVLLVFFSADKKVAYAKGEHRGFMRTIELQTESTIMHTLEKVIGARVYDMRNQQTNEGMSAEEILNRTRAGGSVPIRRFVIEDPNFKEKRIEAGLTQAQLARKAKVPVDIVRKIEEDWKEVGIDSIQAVSEALGIKIKPPHFELK